MKLIVASKINGFADAIKKQGYDVVASIDSTDELERIFASSESIANTLLVTEKINTKGSLVGVLLNIHEKYPEIRIIFLATGDLSNRFTVNQLYMLASKGIYDLFYQGKIDEQKLVDLIENPKTELDCQEIFDTYDSLSTPQAQAQPEQIEKQIVNESTALDNVVAVTSVKPGTGKSFVSSNLAVTLAMYGKKENGSKPKILLLEGDLQTLSIYTLFGIKDDNYKSVAYSIEGMGKWVLL